MQGEPQFFGANPFYYVRIHRCPKCNEETIKLLKCSFENNEIKEIDDSNLVTQIRPKSIHQPFPDYVPQSIRNDYEEACAIVELSPKASATLARRCLQGMIRDFWNVPGNTKGLLAKEIDALKGKIPETQWNAIDALRKIGNIGAHMEKDTNIIVDIDTGEAEKLIKLIELLIKQWYIARHEEEQLLSEIVAIKDEKEAERKPSNSPT
ncbi:MAG: DUF4145 domain-containing protein [Oscillospiraceae bacterium]|nr:DUF4145 domain-containing protein [Oscillospiraceae bacterium]